MNKANCYKLFCIILFLGLCIYTKAQSGFVNMAGNNSNNCSYSIGQTFANNKQSVAGYTNEGLQHSFLFEGVDTLLTFEDLLPYTYREANRNPLGVSYAYSTANLYNDQYLLPIYGIDSLIDVMFFTVKRPLNVDTVAPYSVCAIPILLPQPLVNPVPAVPPVRVSNNELSEYPCNDTTVVTWRFDAYNKSITHNQNVIVHFPPCGQSEGMIAIDADGNQYDAVRLSCYCWTKKNLRSLHYDNSTGNEIPVALAYYADIYPNTTANVDTFGRLYSWYSTMNVPEGDDTVIPMTDADGHIQGVCPAGWRVPTMTEWASINVYPVTELISTTQWIMPGGNNATNFSALPAGIFFSGRFWNLRGNAYFWSCNGDGAIADASQIAYSCLDLLNLSSLKENAMSVRCIKN